MNKLSKKQVALVRSLKQKKGRKQLNLFMAEGTKIVPEFMKEGFIILGDEKLEKITDFLSNNKKK